MTHQPNKFALRAAAAERRDKHAQRTPLPGDDDPGAARERRERLAARAREEASYRHYPRFDATICLDPAECEAVYHPQLASGDCCECCGAVIE